MTAVVFTAPLQSVLLFAIGVGGIGFGSGMFAHSTLTVAMKLAPKGQIGLALGVWGAVQASASGGAIAISGVLRDGINGLARSGHFGDALSGPATGYSAVYNLEILLLFATLVAIGPLVRFTRNDSPALSTNPAFPDFHLSPPSRELVP